MARPKIDKNDLVVFCCAWFNTLFVALMNRIKVLRNIRAQIICKFQDCILGKHYTFGDSSQKGAMVQGF